MPKNELNNNIKIDKNLYQFPFLQLDDLFIGNVEDYKIIQQEWNMEGNHYKLWISIKDKAYLVVGYNDEGYSAVNRVLAAQTGKLLGINCEEVFLGFYHGKCVNVIPQKECISLLENQMFEIYELNHLNYLAQNENKKMFYFLIQHWYACYKDDRKLKEKFNENFIDTEGNVFVSNLQHAAFLTPQQMPKNLLIPLKIDKYNYAIIQNSLKTIKKHDVTELIFGSISDEFIEFHDSYAHKANKTNFFQKKNAFEANYDNLLESLGEFEGMVGL